MDIRHEFAREVAEPLGAIVLTDHCECGWPLMERPDQELPFCWGCTTDKRTAVEGRALLLKARLAERGIDIPTERAWRAAEEDPAAQELRGPFKFGMPL